VPPEQLHDETTETMKRLHDETMKRPCSRKSMNDIINSFEMKSVSLLSGSGVFAVCWLLAVHRH
jgi:hypothetical protein